MRAPRIFALVVFILVVLDLILAVGLTRLLLLDINVSVRFLADFHSYLHVMAEDRSVDLRRNMDVMGVRKANAVPGIVMAITAHDHKNHQCTIASKA